MNKECEKDIEYLKKFTEYTKNRATEEYQSECKNIQYAKDLEKRAKVFENILNYIENSIPKEEYTELLQENIKMKDLLNTQSRIAEILEFPTNQKMVKFSTGFYIPKNMIFSKAVDKDETLQLEYVNATSLLKYKGDKVKE